MKALFSPLGMSCGSLFSAIVLVKTDHVVIITSQEAAENILKVVKRPKISLQLHL